MAGLSSNMALFSPQLIGLLLLGPPEDPHENPHYVIRFDLRHTGPVSTAFPLSPNSTALYLLQDMAEEVVGLAGHLGHPSAHRWL